MLQFTFQTEIYAKTQTIWDMYTNCEKRCQWEKELDYITVQGDFKTGSSGTMKFKGQPEMPYSLTSVIPMKEFWDKTVIFDSGMAVCFGHEFIDQGESTLLKTTAQLEKRDGITTIEDILFLSQVFSDSPHAVLTLKQMVEKNNV